MEYRYLGKSGVKVSALCLGTMNFGGRAPEKESIDIIHMALDAGINFLDTANIYAKGVSEEIVGKALQEPGNRDNIILATKVAMKVGTGPNDSGCSRSHIMRECEKSLKRLQTDYIDIYYLHNMDLATPLEETLGTLDILVQQGKIRYPACSKHAPSVLTEAMMLCERYGWAKFICEQPPYNLVDRRIENEHLRTCIRFGLGVVPWAPIGAGLLSGKYRKDAPLPPSTRWNGEPDGLAGRRFRPEGIERADRLNPLAAAKGVSLAEFSLAWVMQQPGISAPIIGPRTMEHLESSLRATEIEITDDDRRQIDEIAPPCSAVADYYDYNVNRLMRNAIGIRLPWDA